MIRPVEPDDFDLWRLLWSQYLVFYETQLPEEHTFRLWERLLDDHDEIECLVAVDGDEVVGFTHYLPHADTWSDTPICYLQDLFVGPGARGGGFGEGLIHAVRSEAAANRWGSVYWQTAEDNEIARRLYDRVTGGSSGFIVYEIDPAE